MRKGTVSVLVVGLLFAVVAWWGLADRRAPDTDPLAVERSESPVDPAVLQGVDPPEPSPSPKRAEDARYHERTRRRTKLDPSHTRMIRGAVYDDGGVPIAGALVSSNASSWVHSDERGRFEVRVDNSGDVVVCTRAPGFKARVWTTRVAPDQEYVELTLVRGVALALRVVSANGRPVTGAEVHTRDGETLAGRTDAGGRVVLEVGSPNADFLVWVVTRHLDPAHPDAVFGPLPAGPDVHVLTLPEAHWIEGEVCWADGQPAVIGGGGAVVEVPHPFAPLQVWTDGRTGRFRIGPVARGEQEIRAWWGSLAPAGYTTVPVPGEYVRLVVPYVATFECFVELTEDAKITQATWVARGTACEIGLSSRTPARLREYLPDVRGTFYVQDSAGRYAYVPDVLPSDVPATIRLGEGGEISGVLIYDDLADVVLETWGVPIRGHVDLLADIDEPPFRIRGLPPGAKGTLRVMDRDDSRALYEQRVRSDTHDLRIEIPLEPGD